MFEEYIGKVFDERYEIEAVIGTGGMAVVFKGTDLKKGIPVAVKMLMPKFYDDSQAVTRFVNEGKAMSLLSHENIVTVYGVSFSDTVKYIIMELIDGITLKNYIEEHGALKPSEVANYTDQILAALSHAHSKGVIHRDIKPQNIMLLKNGRIKVTDFGIAQMKRSKKKKHEKNAVSHEDNAGDDKTVGTVYYVSPEQASGQAVDERSDIYSLGTVMYELATGTVPFENESPESIALMQINNAAKRPGLINPKIPRGLEDIIVKAMEKDPDDRFPSAYEMHKCLMKVNKDPNKPIPVRKTVTKETRGGDMLPAALGALSAFIICAAVAAIFIVNTLFFSGRGDARVVTVAYCIGNECTEDYLKSLGNDYSVEVTPVYDNSVTKGFILSQSPSGGEERRLIGDQKIKLSLTVSLGAKTSVLSDYSMLDAREVEIILREAGFGVKKVRQENAAVPDGCVISTYPIPGVTVTEGEIITLYVSAGEKIEYTTVPDFTGKDEETVYSMIISSKLGIGVVTYVRSDKPAGTVLYQSVKSGEKVPVLLTKVDFTVSGGPTYSDGTEAAETTKAEETGEVTEGL